MLARVPATDSCVVNISEKINCQERVNTKKADVVTPPTWTPRVRLMNEMGPHPPVFRTGDSHVSCLNYQSRTKDEEK